MGTLTAHLCKIFMYMDEAFEMEEEIFAPCSCSDHYIKNLYEKLSTVPCI